MQDAELIFEFVEEAREHLSDVESQLLQIEAMGADINDELVNTVFRAVHSVKGAAGFLGLTQINTVAHRFENVLGRVRDHQLVPDPFNVDVMLKAADRLLTLIESIESSNDTDNVELCQKLDALLADEADEQVAAKPASKELVTEGLETETELGQASEVKGSVAAEVEKLTDKALEAIEQGVQSAQSAESSTTCVATSPSETAKPEIAKASSASTSSAAPEGTIRVGVRVLDGLMNLAGELVLSRNQLLRVLGERDTGSNLDSIVSGLDHVTTELQETIMQTRMQPIGNVFSKFNRVVRDLSNKLGKQCDLHIEGKEVEVDKTIIEAISDPLTHLVRNSVDHGFEMPSERAEAGKPAVGKLNLRAYHQSGKVRIEIADDGKGIDASILKEKAISKNLLTREQADAMGEREAVRLIFHPGFSTAQEVTDVSGRGVGMDVVRSNIEKLGGTVDVETQVGEGTTIIVTLPLTLAIIPSLIVRSGDDRFAIPQVNIAELVRIRSEEEQRIEQVSNKEVLRLRGNLLPLVRLQEALAQTDPENEASCPLQNNRARHIVVVESGPLRYGLIVDDVFDSEEIVVKPLGRHLKECPCLSGATILGDGRVALILDVNGTAQQSRLRVNEEEDSSFESSSGEVSDRRGSQSVLLFTNDPSEQFAVPMETVARIERICSNQIVTVGSQELIHYRGGSLPLLRLENCANANPGPEQERLYVIVFEAAGHEVGVIAAHLIDIREVSDEFDATTFDDAGVIGSQVINGTTTRLLDTIKLARISRPDWFDSNSGSIDFTGRRNRMADTQSEVESTSNGDTVLLAEDSSFFRRQVKRFLVDTGFQVIDCEDGRDAWRKLSNEPERFRLVLTDIEMPNMDGLELTRKIRSDNRFAELPIIALTSLASQEDFQRGFDAGVTEYQVKLDRDKLIAAIRRYATATALAASELATV